MKWLDKRPVLMISTCPSHQAELKATGKKTRKGEDTFKPQAVIDYNNAKKGVDISEQMSSYYTCIRKSIKWYKKVFFEILLGTCMVNSWVIYYGRNAKKLSMLQFREKVARGLLEEEDIEENIKPEDIAANVPEQRVTKRPRASSRIAHHKMQKYDGTVRMIRKRCTSCYRKLQSTSGVKEARNKAKRVSTFCKDCPEQPTLCLQCFNEIHK
ncbi:unnamed protein product [Acanthoscelides obtectus]|uniref:PiggyBac transposable element-derived protein domain-containing protein n=1 Tax=Acanthoscelides obtectus TaxID=200917 RepID=A0A9P0PV68_ACAOB|nr:unnamed protein product [Acanthoscelides obtectus]CAK1651338.1 PiggyBac transposable element-derived protein 4 [Acanthoscelides obtectus]